MGSQFVIDLSPLDLKEYLCLPFPVTVSARAVPFWGLPPKTAPSDESFLRLIEKLWFRHEAPVFLCCGPRGFGNNGFGHG